MLDFPLETRTIDGAGNNLANPVWGMAETTTLRLASIAYEDGAGEPAGQDRPSERAISNAIFAQTGDEVNGYGATDYLWQWGQFLDHDIVEVFFMQHAGYHVYRLCVIGGNDGPLFHVGKQGDLAPLGSWQRTVGAT